MRDAKNYQNQLVIKAKIHCSDLLKGIYPYEAILPNVFFRYYMKPFVNYCRYLNYEEFIDDDQIKLYLEMPQEVIDRQILSDPSDATAIKILPMISRGGGNAFLIDYKKAYDVHCKTIDFGKLTFRISQVTFHLYDHEGMDLYKYYLKASKKLFAKYKHQSIDFDAYHDTLPYIEVVDLDKKEPEVMLRLDFLMFFYNNYFNIVENRLFNEALFKESDYVPFSLAPFEAGKDLSQYRFRLMPGDALEALPSEYFTLDPQRQPFLDLALRKRESALEIIDINTDARINDLDHYGLILTVMEYATGKYIETFYEGGAFILTGLKENYQYLIDIRPKNSSVLECDDPIEHRFIYKKIFKKYQCFLKFTAKVQGKISDQ